MRWLVAGLTGLLLGGLIRNQIDDRAWQKADASVNEAADLWGQRLREGDQREERMLRLAERQVRLGWLSLGVAVASATVAVVALVN